MSYQDYIPKVLKNLKWHYGNHYNKPFEFTVDGDINITRHGVSITTYSLYVNSELIPAYANMEGEKKAYSMLNSIAINAGINKKFLDFNELAKSKSL